MAKLPEIQRSQAAPLQSIGPAAAAAPHLSKAKVIGQAADMALKINEMADKINVNNANADYKQAISNFKQYMMERTDPFDQEALKLMRIDDKVDASEGDVPVWEAMPHALAQYTADMQEKYGGNIRSPKLRSAWQRDTALATIPELERSVQEAANMAVQGMADEQMARYDAHILSGEFEAARQVFADNPIFTRNPKMAELKRQSLAQVDVAQEKWELNDLLVQGEYEEVMDRMSDPERDSPLSSDDRRKMYFAAATKRDDDVRRREKAEVRAKEGHYKDLTGRLLDGTAGIDDVVREGDLLQKSDFNSAVTLARSLSREHAAADGPTADAIENALLVEIRLARAGVFDDSFEDLDAFKADINTRIAFSATTENVDGEIAAGLSPARIRSLFKELDSLDDAAYQTRAYKNLSQQMKLRIMRSEDNSIGLIATEDSSSLMAEALDSLDAYIRREGPDANLDVWKNEQLPRYYRQAAQAASLNLPKDLQRYLVTTGEDETFGVDYEATRAAIQEKLNEYRINKRDTATLEERLRKFDDYERNYRVMTDG
jgi:hypothetical protein